jgi:hypothetical protein
MARTVETPAVEEALREAEAAKKKVDAVRMQERVAQMGPISLMKHQRDVERAYQQGVAVPTGVKKKHTVADATAWLRLYMTQFGLTDADFAHGLSHKAKGILEDYNYTVGSSKRKPKKGKKAAKKRAKKSGSPRKAPKKRRKNSAAAKLRKENAELKAKLASSKKPAKRRKGKRKAAKKGSKPAKRAKKRGGKRGKRSKK